MPLVIEIGLLGTLNGKPHNNIFHVIEDTGLLPLDDALNVFESTYLPAVIVSQVEALVYNQLTARPLDILDNRTPIVRPINVTGDVNTNDYMPAGNHLWTVFETAGIGLKAGGKIISGWAEGNFTNGEPVGSLLDNLESALNTLRVVLSLSGFFLSVFRPTFSIPGVPVASIVTAVRTRGDSTNNRRMNPFIR